jgi:hypothetical protein
MVFKVVHVCLVMLHMKPCFGINCGVTILLLKTDIVRHYNSL